MTFYDFDYGISQVQGARPAIEIMQMGPQASYLELQGRSSEIQQYDSWTSIPQLTQQARDIIATMPASADWGTTGAMVINHGTRYGVGDDNPFDPYTLTELQASRSIMVMFEHVNTFQVRYAIGACCTTGRNFLFGGHSRPLC